MTHYPITCRQWTEEDLPNLLSYLIHLSPATKQRFGPHPLTAEAIHYLYHHPDYIGFLIIENHSTYIIGYGIIKKGYLDHDFQRLSSYGIVPNRDTDATYAPSLADDWQGKGIGHLLWKTITAYLQTQDTKRVILWGGVQINNIRAVNYYQKLGFELLGEFEFGGMKNNDMICIL